MFIVPHLIPSNMTEPSLLTLTQMHYITLTITLSGDNIHVRLQKMKRKLEGEQHNIALTTGDLLCLELHPYVSFQNNIPAITLF